MMIVGLETINTQPQRKSEPKKNKTKTPGINSRALWPFGFERRLVSDARLQRVLIVKKTAPNEYRRASAPL